MSKTNPKLDLERLRAITIFLQESLEHGSPEEAEIAITELEDVVDEFVEKFGKDLQPEVFEKARLNPDYFLILIDRAERKNKT